MGEAELNILGIPGKLSVKHDIRTLKTENYVDLDKFTDVPQAYDWSTKKTSPWGWMNNRHLADCTCAAAGHMIECWTANSTKEHHVSSADILTAYCALSNYDPVTKKNNQPVSFWALLRYWRKFGIGGHKILAYTTVAYRNHDLVRAVVYLFGGAYAGLNLPNSIQGQEIWKVKSGKLGGDSKPGSYGGHAVNIVAYDEQYVVCVSYGQIKKMTWAFWDAYSDELYAIITQDFIADGKTPTGFNIAKLIEDLKGVTKSPKTTEKQIADL